MPRIDNSTPLHRRGEGGVDADRFSRGVAICLQQTMGDVLRLGFCHHAFEVSSQFPPFLKQGPDVKNDVFPTRC